jgi:hypothetical protein
VVLEPGYRSLITEKPAGAGGIGRIPIDMRQNNAVGIDDLVSARHRPDRPGPIQHELELG